MVLCEELAMYAYAHAQAHMHTHKCTGILTSIKRQILFSLMSCHFSRRK
jgi:hypothetical protein